MNDLSISRGEMMGRYPTKIAHDVASGKHPLVAHIIFRGRLQETNRVRVQSTQTQKLKTSRPMQKKCKSLGGRGSKDCRL